MTRTKENVIALSLLGVALIGAGATVAATTTPELPNEHYAAAVQTTAPVSPDLVAYREYKSFSDTERAFIREAAAPEVPGGTTSALVEAAHAWCDATLHQGPDAGISTLIERSQDGRIAAGDITRIVGSAARNICPGVMPGAIGGTVNG